jgi:hypothetical protein
MARTNGPELDEDGIPRRWSFSWDGGDVAAEGEVSVRPIPMAWGWGGPAAPTSRVGYVIFPLVLDAAVTVRSAGHERELSAIGLGEYYDADAWEP